MFTRYVLCHYNKPMKATIALLSDFGTEDHFAGVINGVIKNINPQADIIDLCHHIAPYDILEGALLLKSSYRYFPKKTIFLTVVDPGVGTQRKPIIMKTKDYTFVGPDNGILSFVVAQNTRTKFYQIINERYFLMPISNTFHGRDIFAPVAAYISRGLPLRTFGPQLKSITKINLPSPTINKQRKEIIGEIIYSDRFGNLVTNIEEKHLERVGRVTTVRIKGRMIRGLNQNYSQTPAGKLLAITNSTKHLEISLNQGSAKQYLKAKKGERVTLSFKS